ncbi:neprilysin-1-like [Dermacentor andersoni]|uniref:neprilysin-1-like n=1 Tax=Dermacentor andersoni TaxID=34620 RepID=UPI002415D47F|nr:neprilysin-1-like [Dermacentor andersoni]
MSLTQLWEETRLVWHALRDTPEADEDYRLPGSYTQPYARYWYLLNTVRLSLGLLAQPAYHREGTRAMLFGGLGFLFARQLVGAVDGSGIGVDAMGKPVAGSWIGDSTARVNFEKRLRCEVDLFPDVPAVEVAFAAFLDGASSGLRLSRRFSELQVFFLTLCHLTCACGHPDNLYGADCNRVVKNFQPFADAFRCAPGSKMNPTNKCRFFG